MSSQEESLISESDQDDDLQFMEIPQNDPVEVSWFILLSFSPGIYKKLTWFSLVSAF